MKRWLFIVQTFICLISVNCNLDFKETERSSTSIQDSKARGVFLKKYEIDSIERYNSNISFPVAEVWSEKAWKLTLDKYGRQIHKVDTNETNIVIRLKFNDSLRYDNFHKSWFVWDVNRSPISIQDSVISEVENRTIMRNRRFIVYALESPYNINDNSRKIASFVILRK